jgi:hypothetical protein
MSQKTSDFSAIPLCSAHHRQAEDSYHRLGEQSFARLYRINLPQLAMALNDSYGSYASSGTRLIARSRRTTA